MVTAGNKVRTGRWQPWLLLPALLALAWAFVQARPAGSATEPDPRFGIVESFWVPEEAEALDVGWERIIFYWREIQPTGPDDWNTLHVREEWLRAAVAQGQPVVGLLKNTPLWATDAPSEGGLPRGLYLPPDDPGNLWAGYVREIARYYGPRGVHHWIVWNEPEIAAGVFGHEFDGSVDDYVRLLKVAYLVMKEEDPLAVIHLAGLTWWHDPAYLAELLAAIARDPDAAANNEFFDVISLHIYFRAETVREILLAVAEIQATAGTDKPVWINETNASPNLDPDWPVVRPAFQVDLEQQAWFIVQAYALGFASGAGSIGVYKLLDISLPPGGESFGLLRPDKSRRPAFFAYQTTIAQLRDFTAVSLEEAPTYYVVTFQRPQGVTRVVWARTRQDVALQLPAWGRDAQLLSATGEALPLPAGDRVDGQYTLLLPGARCAAAPCDVGGAPLFLVEAGAAAPAVDPAPAFLPTGRPTLTATPSPTATPTSTLSPTPTPTATPPPSSTPVPTSAPASATPSPAATAGTTAPAPEPGTDISDTIGLVALAGAALVAIGVALLWLQRRS